jgi:hypothetical protein
MESEEIAGLIAALDERLGFGEADGAWGDSDEGLMHLQALALSVAPAAGLDVDAVAVNARTFLANFPTVSLPLGDVDVRAARWLAQLMDGPARPALRERLASLASECAADHPLAAAQVAAWSEGPPPANPTEDAPWLQALIALARAEL